MLENATASFKTWRTHFPAKHLSFRPTLRSGRAKHLLHGYSPNRCLTACLPYRNNHHQKEGTSSIVYRFQQAAGKSRPTKDHEKSENILPQPTTTQYLRELSQLQTSAETPNCYQIGFCCCSIPNLPNLLPLAVRSLVRPRVTSAR